MNGKESNKEVFHYTASVPTALHALNLSLAQPFVVNKHVAVTSLQAFIQAQIRHLKSEPRFHKSLALRSHLSKCPLSSIHIEPRSQSMLNMPHGRV